MTAREPRYFCACGVVWGLHTGPASRQRRPGAGPNGHLFHGFLNRRPPPALRPLPQRRRRGSQAGHAIAVIICLTRGETSSGGGSAPSTPGRSSPTLSGRRCGRCPGLDPAGREAFCSRPEPAFRARLGAGVQAGTWRKFATRGRQNSNLRYNGGRPGPRPRSNPHSRPARHHIWRPMVGGSLALIAKMRSVMVGCERYLRDGAPLRKKRLL